MEYRTLGRTNLRVSVIGMGGVSAAGKYGPVTEGDSGSAESRTHIFKGMRFYEVVPDSFARVMSRAEELGMNFVDTAPSYADSELVLGHYFRDHRDRWLICTKVGVCGSWGSGELMSRDMIFEQVSQSLQRLQVDYVDLILIHSLDQYGEGESTLESVLAPGGMIEPLRELQKQGKTRFIGVSGQLPELIPATKSGAFDVILTYNTFNLLIQDAQQELFPIARENNVGVILGGAFHQGLLTGNPDFVLERKEEFFEKKDPAYYRTQELMSRVERLMEFVGGDARALRQLAIRFTLSDPVVSVVVSGAKTPQEVEDNVAASELGPLTEAEMESVMAVVNSDSE